LGDVCQLKFDLQPRNRRPRFLAAPPERFGETGIERLASRIWETTARALASAILTRWSSSTSRPRRRLAVPPGFRR